MIQTAQGTETAAILSDGGVESRAAQIIAVHVSKPFPPLAPIGAADAGMGPDGVCWGRAVYAAAALASGTDVTGANAYLQAIHDEVGTAFDGTSVMPCSFGLPTLWRSYIDPTLSAQLTPTTRSDLLNLMERYVAQRSRVSDAYRDWFLGGTENIDAHHRAALLLATEALVRAGQGDTVLADGNSLYDHATAWNAYWQRYFMQHANEGVSCEIDSPTYNKYTIEAYYAVRDLAGDATTRALADHFLSLYYADAAQNFVPGAGLRGGAWTRMYKNEALTTTDADGLISFFWLYGWIDNDGNVDGQSDLDAALSSYRVPPIVTAIATAPNKPPYAYTSRRFGMGYSTGTSDFDGWQITFDPQGSSHLVRQSFVNPEYTVGALVDDPSQTYTLLEGQNKAMGALFADGERLIVYGKGGGGGSCDATLIASPQGCVTDHYGIFGVAAPGALVVGRDPNVAYSGGPTRVFVSSGLAKSAQQQGGWTFFTNGKSFAAARAANGASGAALTPVVDAVGNTYYEESGTEPMVVQLAQSTDFASFAAFQQAVLSQPAPALDGTGWLAYQSLHADLIELQAQKTAVPRVNGTTVNLAPLKTYDSPYLSGVHGSSTVAVSFPGYTPLSLSFLP